MPITPSEKAQATFEKVFDCRPSHVFIAPGRVNLIGEHTDYNEGFVLPCAISFHTAIACKQNQSDKMRIVAADYDNTLDIFDLSQPIEKNAIHWTNYLRGVAAQFLERKMPIGGLDIVIAGNIPQGTGLSSSASLEICFANAINTLFNTGMDPKELAVLCQRAENQFVGCNCGIMDQLISSCGEKEAALLIDCRSLETQCIQIPSSLQLLIINPNVERKLVGSEYNVRRESCEKASSQLKVKALRDATLEQLDANEAIIDETTFKRARHIITENQRVLDMVEACQNNDLPTIKQLLKSSHASMKEDFEITTPQLDFIADYINDHQKHAGGARMTGGGFGGCAVALIPIELVTETCSNLKTAYEEKFHTKLTIYRAEISQGAHAL